MYLRRKQTNLEEALICTLLDLQELVQAPYRFRVSLGEYNQCYGRLLDPSKEIDEILTFPLETVYENVDPMSLESFHKKETETQIQSPEIDEHLMLQRWAQMVAVNFHCREALVILLRLP